MFLSKLTVPCFWILLTCSNFLQLRGQAPTDWFWVQPGSEIPLTLLDQTELELAWDGGALRTITGPVLAPQKGLHWLAVVQRDRAGRVSEPQFLAIGVDGDPPEGRLVVLPEPVMVGSVLWVGPTTEVEWQVQDPLSGIAMAQLSSAEGSAQTISPTRMRLDQAGSYSFSATASDRAGNLAAPATLTLQLDATPPLTTCQWRGPHHQDGANLYIGPETQAELVVSDTESGIGETQYLLEGQSCSSADWAHPSADEFHLGATVHDRVGNLKTLEVGPVFRDAEGPLIEWHFLQPDYQDPKGRAWFRKSGAELQIAVKDGLSGVNRLEWRVEGQTWQVLDQRQIRVTTPISLRAWDRVDNQTTMSVALLIDADAPEIAVSENGQPLKVDWLNPVPAAARVSLAFSDAGCGVAERILRVYPANRSPDGAPSLTFPAGEARILVITGKGPRYQLHSQPSEDRDWIYFERAGVYWIEITAVDYLGNRKKSDFGFWVGDYGMVAP